MAYTRTPLNSTDQNTQIPLLQQWATRDISNSKDIVTKNVIWEIVSGPNGPETAVAVKREGHQLIYTAPSPIYCVHFWNSGLSNYLMLFGVFGAISFTISNVDVGTSLAPFSTSNVVSFGVETRATEFQYENGTVEIIVTDGNNLCRYDASTLTPITDPDRPIQHQPYPVYLDGYLFLADLNGNICNSDLNNPASWTAGNFIGADMYPDKLLAIARNGVYIVAFGQYSLQFYYDAANSTGTPLALQNTTSPQIGFLGGLATIGDTLMFAGQLRGGPPSIYRMDGLKVVDVGNNSVSREMATFSGGITKWFGHVLNYQGHKIYTCTVTLLSGAPADPYPFTYALDIDTGQWFQLTWQGSAVFDLYTSTTAKWRNGFTSILVFWTGGASVNLYSSNLNVYQDAGVNFDVQFTTKNYDFGTRRIKFGTRLLVNADQPPSTSNVLISWSDDDYQTFNSPRTVNLANSYTQLYSLGSFRRRAYKVTYTDNFPMRFVSLEKDYSIGQA